MSNEVKITVVFDDVSAEKNFEGGWGFSAFVEGLEKRILFDTGADGSKLFVNMQKLDIATESVDAVVLSHMHPDHTGGIWSLLERNTEIEVYVPVSFSSGFKEEIQKYGVKMIEVGKSVQICRDVYSTGQIGSRIKEQGLVFKTAEGIVVIVGCSHPGIVKMVKAAKKVLDGRILLLMGGFHLEWSTGFNIKWIISKLKRLGVEYAAASHCTSRRAKSLIAKNFGDRNINIGVGKAVRLGEL